MKFSYFESSPGVFTKVCIDRFDTSYNLHISFVVLHVLSSARLLAAVAVSCRGVVRCW